MKHPSQETQKVVGEYTMFSLPALVARDSKLVSDLRDAVRSGNNAFIKNLVALGVIQEVSVVKNIIPTTGRNVLARILAGDVTYTGEINYGALGSAASPAFSNASTQLTTEVYRSLADSQAFDSNIAYIDWFVASGDVADQTFQEFGAFIDGTASANSGQAWSLLKTGGWVKSGSMFISGKYTFL